MAYLQKMKDMEKDFLAGMPDERIAEKYKISPFHVPAIRLSIFGLTKKTYLKFSYETVIDMRERIAQGMNDIQVVSTISEFDEDMVRMILSMKNKVASERAKMNKITKAL